jgi:hypothetical protein
MNLTDWQKMTTEQQEEMLETHFKMIGETPRGTCIQTLDYQDLVERDRAKRAGDVAAWFDICNGNQGCCDGDWADALRSERTHY